MSVLTAIECTFFWLQQYSEITRSEQISRNKNYAFHGKSCINKKDTNNVAKGYKELTPRIFIVLDSLVSRCYCVSDTTANLDCFDFRNDLPCDLPCAASLASIQPVRPRAQRTSP